MKRLNITLPENLARELETIPNKSRFIAEALKEKLENMKRKKLDKLLIEGYKETVRLSSPKLVRKIRKLTKSGRKLHLNHGSKLSQKRRSVACLFGSSIWC